MKAVIELYVPEWQIGQDVSVYFPDTMVKHGKCELLKEQDAVVRCKDCKYGEQWGVLIGCGTSKGFGITHNPDWYCADGVRKE